MRELNFDMCVVDNNVWSRKAIKGNGTEYFENILVYTVDFLVVSEKPHEVLTCLDQHYILKPGSIGQPTQYLGAQIGQYRLPKQPDKLHWSLRSEKHTKEAIKKV
jgi:hypothetical protein